MKKVLFFLFLFITASINAENPLTKITTKDAPSVYDVENPAPHLESLNMSQGIKVKMTEISDMVFISGQVALNPITYQEEEETIESAVDRTMNNIEAVLKEAGSDWQYVVRMDVFLKDPESDFAGMAKIYGKRFPNGFFPVRQTVGVNMVNRVEISCIAVIPI
ncbi:MAG TPA: RidA family protein [Rhabdochlamydiaceae bacterium]|nr:RidA family protein [Rhabdochlamydiaceae bacterium]